MKKDLINLTKDAYGQEIWTYFKGNESHEIIERDDNYIDISGGPEPYFDEFKDWPQFQQEAIKFANGKCLDVGAGAGRVSLYLQNLGLEVLAIDNSPLAIKVCRERGVKNAKLLAFENIEELKPSKFDTIIMYGNNFGLFENFEKAQLILKKLHQITNDNSIIIAESNDPYKTDDPVHLSYHKLNKSRGKMSGQITIRVRFKNYIGDWFEYLLVSKSEMKEILEGTGWKINNFIDSISSSYIAIIEKDI